MTALGWLLLAAALIICASVVALWVDAERDTGRAEDRAARLADENTQLRQQLDYVRGQLARLALSESAHYAAIADIHGQGERFADDVEAWLADGAPGSRP